MEDISPQIEHLLIATLELAAMDYFGIRPVSPEEEFFPSAEDTIAPNSRVPSPAIGAHISKEPQVKHSRVDGLLVVAPCTTQLVGKDVQQIKRNAGYLLSLSQSTPTALSTKPSTRFEQENQRRPDLQLDTNDNYRPIPDFIIRPPTPFHHPKYRRSFSSPPTSSSPTFPPSTQEELTTLRAALLVVQSHISRLDEGIKANIAEQVKRLEVPDRVVMDADSLPNFKAEKNDAEVSRALLKTVKVCCIVERGLEALMEVLEEGEIPKIKSGRRRRNETGRDGDDGGAGRSYDWGRRERHELDEGRKEKKEGLLGVCLESPRAVRREMGSALKGFEGVIGFTEK